jgi:hypothetical protein
MTILKGFDIAASDENSKDDPPSLIMNKRMPLITKSLNVVKQGKLLIFMSALLLSVDINQHYQTGPIIKVILAINNLAFPLLNTEKFIAGTRVADFKEDEAASNRMSLPYFKVL